MVTCLVKLYFRVKHENTKEKKEQKMRWQILLASKCPKLWNQKKQLISQVLFLALFTTYPPKKSEQICIPSWDTKILVSQTDEAILIAPEDFRYWTIHEDSLVEFDHLQGQLPFHSLWKVFGKNCCRLMKKKKENELMKHVYMSSILPLWGNIWAMWHHLGAY